MPATSSTVSEYDPEVELLLCCARTKLEPANVARVQALVLNGLDWDRLISLAHFHGVRPLLFRNLKATCFELLPETFRDELGRHIEAHTRQNLFETGELVKLLQLFEDRCIAVIPYKGPVLAETVYGDIVLREFADLDILVRESDVLAAQDVLASQGYGPRIEPTVVQNAASGPGDDYHNKYWHRECDILLELHWGVTNRHFPFPLDEERLWASLETVSFFGTSVRVLPAEDLLLFLCIHGAKHDPFPWPLLKWICDVAELVRARPDLNWDHLFEKAGRLSSERILLLGLRLAGDLLGTVLPEEVGSRVRSDAVIRGLAGQVCDQLFASTDWPRPDVDKHLFHLRTRDRWQDRLPYLSYLVRFRMTPNTKDRALIQLPSSLSGLYYLLRPVRLVREYAWHSLKYFSIKAGKRP